MVEEDREMRIARLGELVEANPNNLLVGVAWAREDILLYYRY